MPCVAWAFPKPGNVRVTLDQQLLDILACPKCKGTLLYRQQDEALDCPACRLRYHVRDGIPVMLIDEATPLDQD